PAIGTTVSGAGDMTVTLTVTDINGLTNTCTFTVTKVDNTQPTVVCSNSTVNFNGQTSIALDANALVSASDNCGVQSISLSPSTISSTQVGQTVPVTVTVTDIHGNVSTCTSNITVAGLPSGWIQPISPVGCTNCTGSFVFNPSTGTWTGSATGATYNPTSTGDAMMIAGRTLCGDGSITVLVTSITGQGWAGVVMRETNDPGAKKAQLMTNLGSLLRRDFRIMTNGSATSNLLNFPNRFWLRIVRTGNTFALWSSTNGASWAGIASANIPMNQCIQMGLVATSINNTATTTATFSNVSFTGSGGPLLALPANTGPAQLADDNAAIEVDFDVFPNPTSGELNLDLTQYIGRSVRIEMYSLEGKLLQFSELDEVQNTLERLNLKDFQNGMYLVKVKSAGLPDATKRIVLQRG
ncbi:MAG TPA: T9SS type A sorting domain-containing protein, partial [Saprospiraceae bacterium]|nr:T9SS type A sorting domain-containing protein [Saprospiraceae bacterium]HRK82246.1 T9SS type A sorting domain-containing protein [Saprospiraceae bacterium]